MGILKDKNESTVFLFTSLGMFLVYLATLSPSIGSFDSAELTTAAYTLGIIHAPGYPLYLLIAHFFTHLPIGNAAWNLNVLNAIYGSLAIGVVYLCGIALTKSRLASLVSAGILGFSSLFWSISVTTEVYSFHALLLSIVLYQFIRFDKVSSRRNFFYFIFFYGLSISHHLSSILFAPFFLFVLIKYKKEHITWPNILFGAVIFSLPFLFYLYFPIRSLTSPSLNYINEYFFVDLSTPSGIFWLFSGKMFSEEIFGNSFVNGVAQFIRLSEYVWINFIGIGLLVSLYGLWATMKKNKSLGIILGGGGFTVLFFFSFYRVVDNDQMIVSALIALTLAMAVGLARLQNTHFSQTISWMTLLKKGCSELIDRHIYGLNQDLSAIYGGSSTDKVVFSVDSWIRYILKIIPLTTLATALFVNWSFMDRSNDWAAYNYAQYTMQSVDRDSFIIAQWTTATPLEFLQLVENQRADVQIFDRGLFALGLRDQLQDISETKRNLIILKSLTTEIEIEIKKRPVFITENDRMLNDYFCFVKTGILYRVYPNTVDRSQYHCETD